MKKQLLLLCAAISIFFTAFAADNNKNEKPFVIPELREWIGGNGNITIDANTKIVYKKGDAQMEKIAQQFAADLKTMFGYKVQAIAGKASKGDISIAIKKNKKLGAEGYKVTIDDKVTLTASTAQGAFWGQSGTIFPRAFRLLFSFKLKIGEHS